MDDVEAHVARPHLAEDGVQIGAVVVEQAARRVHDARDLLDAALEHSQRRWIGQHQAGRARAHRRAQRVEVDVALGVGRNLARLVTAHHRGGGIGAMRRVRHQDLVARVVAARGVIGADHGDAGELALRAGHRRQRDRPHAGHLLQHLLQLEHAGEETLAELLRRERMPPQQSRQARQRVAGARIVLHGAGTERVEMRVDGEILLRQPGVVAHHLQLGDLGQQRRLAAQKGGRDVGKCRVVRRRRLQGGTARGRGVFEYQAHGRLRGWWRGFRGQRRAATALS
jgi:hypothetical protein